MNNSTTSTQDDVEFEQLIQLLTDNNIFLYAITSVTVLLIYDLLLTFDKEISLIWNKRITFTSFLYYLTRYGSILYLSAQATYSYLQEYLNANLTNLALPFTIVLDTLGTINVIGIQGLLGVRLYAISGGNKYVLAILLILYAIGVGTSIALVSVKLPTGNVRFVTYNHIVNRPLTSGLAINLTQSVAIILFDSLIFIGTVYQTYGTWRLHKEVGVRDRSIAEIILQQGALRYSFIVLITLVNLILRQTVRLVPSEIISFFQQALSPLLLCRLTLQLREKYESQVDKVALPTLAWSVQGIRQTAQYVHDTIIAEAAGEFEWDDSDTDGSIDDDEFELVTERHLSTVSSRTSDLESGRSMLRTTSRASRRMTSESFVSGGDLP